VHGPLCRPISITRLSITQRRDIQVTAAAAAAAATVSVMRAGAASDGHWARVNSYQLIVGLLVFYYT